MDDDQGTDDQGFEPGPEKESVDPAQDGPDLFGGAPAAPREASSTVPPDAASDIAVHDAPIISADPTPVTDEEPPLALYRRYRPDTFDEVIGQEHVTEPLKRALINNRVNHAYLFSGPRGCGKTTSARILARCLNCEQGPTPTPCGQCQSCRDLARGGGGSIDVIEIDAASHGGVDDARDLRERAFFAPVHSRYKIYIVDEAHMVTTAGFNAMLKLVEEPPPHVKFIFATTEPDKVIGTIRSRTHHYPFRLVPPKVLGHYLGELCEKEHVAVAPGVLPLVVRAGAGSVRDSLSVLDQLLGAADKNGVSYEQAAGLLGYTPDSLLDAIMDAFAAGDAAAVFETVDRVIEVGQDPRRFAEDLLRRLRDLVILSAVPDAASTGLIDVSPDQADRLQAQVDGMGRGELTRAAEVIATGLTAMRGTTAPRLHLELMCSRVLLPGVDVDESGINARLDRLERRLALGAPVEATEESIPSSAAGRPSASSRAVTPAPGDPGAAPVIPIDRPRADGSPRRPDRPEHSSTTPDEPATEQRPAGQRPAAQRPAGQRPAGQRPSQQRPPEPTRAGQAPGRVPEPAAPRPSVPEPPAAQPSVATGEGPVAAQPTPASAPRPGPTVADLRAEWPRVLSAVKQRRRFAWMLLSQNAQVLDLADGELVLGFTSQGARDNFASGGSSDVLRDCLVETLMLDVRIRAVADPGAQPAESRPSHHEAHEHQHRDPDPDDDHHHVPSPVHAPHPTPAPPSQRAAGAPPRQNDDESQMARREPAERIRPADDDVSPDDTVLDEVSASKLIMEELGGQIIPDEEP